MVKIIIYILIAFIVQNILYSYIRWRDKRERKKIATWELEYLANSEEFLRKLAIEKFYPEKGEIKDADNNNNNIDNNN